MKGLTVNKNRPESVLISVKNAGTSTISAGTPVCFVMSGSGDGFSVDLPSVVGGNSYAFLAGVAARQMPPNYTGEVQVFGFSPQVVIVRTRAASTTPFSSLPVGGLLRLNTSLNAFEYNTTGAATDFPYQAVLAQSFASVATSTALTETASTTFGKVFLRVM